MKSINAGKVMQLRHTGFVVRDMEKSLLFYKDLLGLKIIKDYYEKGIYIDQLLGLVGINLRIVKLVDDNNSGTVELLEYEYGRQETNTIINGRRIYDIGYSHIAFTVKNIDELYERLLSKGVKFNCPPEISPDGMVKVTMCWDPDYVNVELVEKLKN